MTRAYEEIVDFIAAGSTAGAVAAFTPSNEVRQRVADLLDREKQGNLSSEERAELAHYLELEHLMRLAKAKAQRRISP
jgi:hypothetical protein